METTFNTVPFSLFRCVYASLYDCLPSIRRLVRGPPVARFFQIADFEWKRHKIYGITIAVKIWNITCPLTIK